MTEEKTCTNDTAREGTRFAPCRCDPCSTYITEIVDARSSGIAAGRLDGVPDVEQHPDAKLRHVAKDGARRGRSRVPEVANGNGETCWRLRRTSPDTAGA